MHCMHTGKWALLHVVAQHVANRQYVVSYKVRCFCDLCDLYEIKHVSSCDVTRHG